MDTIPRGEVRPEHFNVYFLLVSHLSSRIDSHRDRPGGTLRARRVSTRHLIMPEVPVPVARQQEARRPAWRQRGASGALRRSPPEAARRSKTAAGARLG